MARSSACHVWHAIWMGMMSSIHADRIHHIWPLHVLWEHLHVTNGLQSEARPRVRRVNPPGWCAGQQQCNSNRVPYATPPMSARLLQQLLGWLSSIDSRSSDMPSVQLWAQRCQCMPRRRHGPLAPEKQKYLEGSCILYRKFPCTTRTWSNITHECETTLVFANRRPKAAYPTCSTRGKSCQQIVNKSTFWDS